MDKVEKVFAIYQVGTYKYETIEVLKSRGYSVLDIDHMKFLYMYDSNGNTEIGISSKNGGTPFKKKNYKFPQNYVDFVCANMNSYDVIIVSTNKDILKALIERGVMFKTIVPDPDTGRQNLLKSISKVENKSWNTSWSYVRDQLDNYQKYITDVIKNADPKSGYITLTGEDPDALELYHVIIDKPAL